MKRKVTRAILLVLTLWLCMGSYAWACSIVEIARPLPRNIRLQVLGVAVGSMDVLVTDWKSGRPRLVRHSQIDSQGKAELRNLPPGDYLIASSLWPPYQWSVGVLVTAADGIADVRAKVVPPQKLPPPVFVRTVDGVVVDPSGAAIPNAVFVLERVDEGHTPVAVGQTSEDGKLSVKVPGGHYIMRVARPGFDTAVVPVRVGDAPDAWTSFQLVMKIGYCGFTGMSHDIRPLN